MCPFGTQWTYSISLPINNSSEVRDLIQVPFWSLLFFTRNSNFLKIIFTFYIWIYFVFFTLVWLFFRVFFPISYLRPSTVSTPKISSRTSGVNRLGVLKCGIPKNASLSSVSKLPSWHQGTCRSWFVKSFPFMVFYQRTSTPLLLVLSICLHFHK